MTSTCPVCGCDQAEGLLCVTDVARLEQALGDVPAIVADLDVTTSRQARIGAQSGPGGLASQRWVYNPGSSAVADDLTNTLTTWARDLLEPGDVLSSGHPAKQAARFLLRRIDRIRRAPAVAELVDEITDAIAQARRAVDRPADRVFVGPCLMEHPDEEGRLITCIEDLYARVGADEVTCRVCGSEHPVAERRAWLLQQAEDRLVTVTEAARYVGQVGNIPVTQQRISAFIRWGKVAYRPGTETFRLGDLLQVILDDTEKRSA